MAFEVVAETPEKFKAWIDHQREPRAQPADEQERRGRDVFLGSPCATCHTIRGTTRGVARRAPISPTSAAA